MEFADNNKLLREFVPKKPDLCRDNHDLLKFLLWLLQLAPIAATIIQSSSEFGQAYRKALLRIHQLPDFDIRTLAYLATVGSICLVSVTALSRKT